MGLCDGLLVRDAAGGRVVYLLTEPATRYYRVMTRGMKYVEEGLEKAEKRYREQQSKRLNRLAQQMGFVLIPRDLNPQPTDS